MQKANSTAKPAPEAKDFEALFTPKNIAVIGATETPGAVGRTDHGDGCRRQQRVEVPDAHVAIRSGRRAARARRGDAQAFLV